MAMKNRVRLQVQVSDTSEMPHEEAVQRWALEEYRKTLTRCRDGNGSAITVTSDFPVDE